MVSAKAKALAITLAIDALAAAWVFVVGGQLLNWWLLANGAASAVIISVLLVRRSRRTIPRAGRISFSEHQKMRGSTYKTMNGELVKSGGERMIADYFFRNKIRYEYEKPVMGTANRRIARPDFYLPDYDIYVEYWGMVATEDGKDRKEYQRGMEWKMAKYKEAGIRFISIYPNEIEILDSAFQKKLKEAT